MSLEREREVSGEGTESAIRHGFLKNKVGSLVLAAAATMWAGGTYAADLTLTPGDCTAGTCWTSDINSQPSPEDIAALVGSNTLDPVYKAEVGNPVTEEGSLAGSYETTFSAEPLDPSAATISYVDGTTPASCPTCYLLVKDGNAVPAYYVFLLPEHYDGTGVITLTDFWPEGGAISNVQLLSEVPLPAAVWLFGSALVGLAGIKRRKLGLG